MRPHSSFCILLLLLCSICTPIEAQDIVVVKTRSLPIVEDILRGFQSVCSGKYPLTIYDMQGSLHQGQAILSEIKDTSNSKKIKAVFTIGLPATTLIRQAMANVPMVFSMVRNPELKGLTGANISAISQDQSAEMQLRYLRQTLPKIQRVAILYNQDATRYKINTFEQVAGKFDLTIKRYLINSLKEVPKTLRQVIAENDALILLPDKGVINQVSLEYFVTTVLENGFPTLAYNRYLVKSGLLMALVPNYYNIGQQAGNRLCNGSSRSLADPTAKHFNFVVNANTAKNINAILIPEILDIAADVY